MNKELEAAKQTALKAGKIILDFYEKKNFTVEDKGGHYQNYLTEADKASEKLIEELLSKQFPDYGFRGEETANEPSEKRFVWIVDPLDGTKGFVNHTNFFGVQIGLTKNGEVVLGVVYLPVFKELFWAVKGKGAFLNDKKISVSKRKEPTDLKLAVSVRALHDENLKQLFDKIKTTHRKYSDSLAYKWTCIARGESDAHLVKPNSSAEWDICAPKIIVEEAGGKVTTFSGKKVTFNRNRINYPEGILVSNKLFHKELLKVLND
ncbi:MAG: inositol monophosphatase [Nanoarchaeota archaeon]|nr:inositol monophosphatase [Nanoarchaeota archaeon]MBU1854590.1 inositol monophosphatase [Nanoarchaeota archaeon]